MNGPTLSDLGLLAPELILVAAALVLILLSRRIRRSAVAPAATVLASLAAAAASVWVMSEETRIGFDGLIVLDGYSQFFKVLIAASLTLAVLLSVRSIDGEGFRVASTMPCSC